MDKLRINPEKMLPEIEAFKALQRNMKRTLAAMELIHISHQTLHAKVVQLEKEVKILGKGLQNQATWIRHLEQRGYGLKPGQFVYFDLKEGMKDG